MTTRRSKPDLSRPTLAKSNLLWACRYLIDLQKIQITRVLCTVKPPKTERSLTLCGFQTHPAKRWRCTRPAYDTWGNTAWHAYLTWYTKYRWILTDMMRNSIERQVQNWKCLYGCYCSYVSYSIIQWIQLPMHCQQIYLLYHIYCYFMHFRLIFHSCVYCYRQIRCWNQ